MKGTDNRERLSTDDELQQLFTHASPREQPPPEDEQEVRQAVHAEWMALSKKRRKGRLSRVVIAAAASVALAVTAIGLLQRSAPEPRVDATRVAAVQKVQGVVKAAFEGAPEVLLDAGTGLVSGQHIRTGFEARMAFAWRNGIELRIDQNSEIRLVSEEEIELLSGRLYVDTGAAGTAGAELRVNTPAGPVRHVGTRYMAAVALGAFSVSVREGRVLFGDGDKEASAGQRLTVDSSGHLSLQVIPVFGERWQWTESVSPAFDADGRPLSDFLDWVARQTGRSVEYTSVEAQRQAVETILHGEIDLSPMDALAVVMQTSDLDSSVVSGTIRVSRSD